MSESEAVAGSLKEEEDCPLCLEHLPAFWDMDRRTMFTCCFKTVCKRCDDDRHAVLQRARAEGTWGRQEAQLGSTCPLCRTEIPHGDDYGRMMADRFEQGQLPQKLYRALGLSFMHGRHGLQRDTARGIEILRLGAERGDPSCQYLLGSTYQEGTDGLPKSPLEAKRWFLAATEKGHAKAEYCLALMAKDEGNDAEHLRYLRGSASKGYDGACYYLGLAYYYGDEGLQQSTEEAIRVLTPAAERGDTDSIGLLGEAMCSQDDEWHTDNPYFTNGMHWLCRAAEAGDEPAIDNLRQLEKLGRSKCF